MSANDSTRNIPAIGDDIRLLGDMLGDIIIEQSGRDVFELEEEIRADAKASRNGDDAARARMHDRITTLADDLPLAANIVTAFSTYFSLVNLAEKHNRINVLRHRTEDAFTHDTAMSESVAAAVATLHQEGFTAEQVEAMLADMVVEPVFTAHPTESKRRTTRQVLTYVSEQLFAHRSPATLEHQRPRLIQNLRAAITLLWQSDMRRDRQPTVMDEVRNTGLYFIEHTLFDVVPGVYRELEAALAITYPDHDWQVPSLLRFGSWIGGDRDGNPFVTPETTESAITAHIDLALGRYAADVRTLYELLSPSRRRVSFDAEFLEQLKQEVDATPSEEAETLDRFRHEPYRQKLILMYERLVATREQNRVSWHERESATRAYESAETFLDDLQQIDQSLLHNNGRSLTRGRLADLIRRVQVFGFHLATLDIRQHSGRHESAIAEIFARTEVDSAYGELPDADRCQLLNREIANPRPLTATLDYSDDTSATVTLFRVIRSAHRHAGVASIQNYVISMTESESDVLEVLLLMSDADLAGGLNVVPLFETVADLAAAPTIMAKLFNNPVYRTHLEQRGNRQQIMIGYSDSNKDGGFLRANWMLFVAQRNLAETCEAHGIQLTLFHGRGGSIGRGGGPANRSILSQPPESIRGRIRLTEQGEVVSSRYTHDEIAFRHLQQLLNAVVCSMGNRPRLPHYDKWATVMDGLSEIAFRAYRQLVEDEDFIAYFQSATPIEQIGELNLGSRPARRKATNDVSDLRAIPWVFAWTQSRTDIPSWYGVGTALNAWAEKPDGLAELQEMYASWPFFRSVLDNVHVGMGRADMTIAALYAELSSPSAKSVFQRISEEFNLTTRRLLEVTGHKAILDTEPWLQRSIRMRNPYVDPMNYVQVALLKRLRETDDEDEQAEILSVILQSINGVASGLQSMG